MFMSVTSLLNFISDIKRSWE